MRILIIIVAIAIGTVIISMLGAAVMTNNIPISLPPPDEKRIGADTSSSETPEIPSAEGVPDASPTSPASQPPPADATVKEYVIIADNYSFAPSVMSVKKGDTVKITLKNMKGTHDLKIDEFAVATKKINGGAEDTIIFIANKSGTFEFYCSVGSHRQLGMKGTLTVIER